MGGSNAEQGDKPWQLHIVMTGSPHSQNGSQTTRLGLSLEAGPLSHQCLEAQEWLLGGIAVDIQTKEETKRNKELYT